MAWLGPHGRGSVGRFRLQYGVRGFRARMNLSRKARRQAILDFCLLPFAVCLLPFLLPAQDWRYYAGEPGGSKYSRLDQINRSNVTKLRLAWTYHTGDLSD